MNDRWAEPEPRGVRLGLQAGLGATRGDRAAALDRTGGLMPAEEDTAGQHTAAFSP